MDKLPKFLIDIIDADVKIDFPYATESRINGEYILIDEYESHRKIILETPLPGS